MASFSGNEKSIKWVLLVQCQKQENAQGFQCIILGNLRDYCPHVTDLLHEHGVRYAGNLHHKIATLKFIAGLGICS